MKVPLETRDDAEALRAYRDAFVEGIREHHARGEPARSWALQFLIRRCAWHMLDHAWELEDRNLTSAPAPAQQRYRFGMAETQREPVPRVDTGELDTALAFLSFARHCVLKKADGLSDAHLRRVVVDSGTSILGLVQHLAEAERYWFGYHLVGADWDADRENGMAVPANRATADVLRDYRATIEDSDRAIRAVGDPDARFAIPVEGNRHTLRWVMAHMTSETARHAGHADILREQLDGTTGR